MSHNTNWPTPPPNFQAQAPTYYPRPVKYTFYHPEGNGFFHVRYIGNGVQGTATLVRAARTGDLFVRKRRHYETDTEAIYLEVNLSRLIDHPNVAKCAAQYKYTDPEDSMVSAVSYWHFYNCTDLYKFRAMFHSAGHRVPEIVVWRCLNQILGALHQAHVQGVYHEDTHGGNIFVNWETTDLVPDFFLGDWGLAERFEVEAGTTADTSDLAVLPLPTLLSLDNYDANNPTDHVEERAGRIPSFLNHFAEEYSVLNDTIKDMMGVLPLPVADDDDDDNSNNNNSSPPDGPSAAEEASSYSPQLNHVASLLDRFEHYLISDHVRTFARYRHIFGLLHAHIHEQEARAWVEHATAETWHALCAAHPDGLPNVNSPTFPADSTGAQIALHPASPPPSAATTAQLTDPQPHQQEENQGEPPGPPPPRTVPKLYDTKQDLEACGFRPPGPWCVAMLDGITGQIIQIDSEVRDLHVTRCTDGNGRFREDDGSAGPRPGQQGEGRAGGAVPGACGVRGCLCGGDGHEEEEDEDEDEDFEEDFEEEEEDL